MTYQLASASSIVLLHDLAGEDKYEVTPQTMINHHY